MMGLSQRWIGLVALGICAACQSEPEPAPVTPEAPAPVAPAEPAGLQVGEQTAFGLPVPVGATAEAEERTFAHYKIAEPYDDVLAFFDRELPDFIPVDYREGRKLSASDLSDREIYVLRNDDGDTLITYADETPNSRVYQSSAARRQAELDEDNPDRIRANNGSAVVSVNRPAPPRITSSRPRASTTPRWAHGDSTADDAPSGSVVRERQRPLGRGTTNPSGAAPIDFVHGEYIAPRNPSAYY